MVNRYVIIILETDTVLRRFDALSGAYRHFRGKAEQSQRAFHV
jgi:hypothetical protein